MRVIILILLASAFVENATAKTPPPAEPRNQFAFKMFDSLSQTPGNLVFSPFSVHAALAMVEFGARGETANQLAAALDEPASPSVTVKKNHPATQISPSLKLANGLWMQAGTTIEPAYLSAIKSFSTSDLSKVDFRADPEKARQKINSWVASKTNDRIPTLFRAGSIKSSDRLVLANAIYFKAEWAEPFMASATNDMPFKVGGMTDVKVPTMRSHESLKYFENDDFQIVQIPYAGDENLAMMIVLPRVGSSVAAAAKSLSATSMSDWATQMKWESVRLALPRFKSSTTLHLVPALKSMGITSAFSKSADFSGISPEPLIIADVVHQAMIIVDETGTEAAAATGIAMPTASARTRSPVSMVIDRPFLYLVERDNTILFMGRVDDPRD